MRINEGKIGDYIPERIEGVEKGEWGEMRGVGVLKNRVQQIKGNERLRGKSTPNEWGERSK